MTGAGCRVRPVALGRVRPPAWAGRRSPGGQGTGGLSAPRGQSWGSLTVYSPVVSSITVTVTLRGRVIHGHRTLELASLQDLLPVRAAHRAGLESVVVGEDQGDALVDRRGVEVETPDRAGEQQHDRHRSGQDDPGDGQHQPDPALGARWPLVRHRRAGMADRREADGRRVVRAIGGWVCMGGCAYGEAGRGPAGRCGAPGGPWGGGGNPPAGPGPCPACPGGQGGVDMWVLRRGEGSSMARRRRAGPRCAGPLSPGAGRTGHRARPGGMAAPSGRGARRSGRTDGRDGSGRVCGTPERVTASSA